jgi:hypothetical protein
MNYLSSNVINPHAESVTITISRKGYDDFTIKDFPIPIANFSGDNHEQSSVTGDGHNYEYPGGNEITVTAFNALDGANIEIIGLPENAKVKIEEHFTNIKVICDHCKKQLVIPISKEDLNWEQVEVHEKPMGKETHYSAEIDRNCDQCGQKIDIVVDVWEYPEGSFYHEIHINGKELDHSNEEDFDSLLPLK